MVAIPRDENRGILLGGVSSSDGTTPVPIYVDPTTHRLYADFTLGTATSGGLDIYRNIDFDTGIEFTTGIALRATTGVADNDTGAPSANDVIVNILYA